MKGLLLKDFYVLTKQMKIILLFIAVFALVPRLTMTAFAIVYVSTIPMTALAFDEKSKWEKVALTMPYTRSQLVISKYVLGLISIVVTGLLILLGNYINTGSFMNETAFKVLLLLFCSSILFTSLLLPALFKFGVEKGRIFFILFAAIFSALIIFFNLDNAPVFDKFSVITEQYFYLIPIATVVILLLSILISVRIYSKKSL